MSTVTSFVNIAAYKFVDLDQLEDRRSRLREFCRKMGLRGTILLSHEGINLFLAGTAEATDEFLKFLRSDPPFKDIEVKESLSDYQPFRRMLVKIKREIITLAQPDISPARKTSAKISATELRRWFEEGRDFTLLDVRNNYEVDLGTFEGAIPAGTDSFRQFPEVVQRLPEDLKKKPIVMFCTGGIRCEKAGPLMENAGFRQILQLDGGILKYFEECGGDHFRGECFVFDQRVAVNPDLEETDTTQCYACQHPLTVDDQKSDRYDPPNMCPYCYVPPETQMARLIEERHTAIRKATSPLPGKQPYDNIRPMNVPERCDGMTVLDFLDSFHPQLGRQEWLERCRAGRIQRNDQVLQPDHIVHRGERIEHHIPATTEPDVNADIQILFEDDSLIVANKPAPLPMHPSGRYNRNTLSHILTSVYSPLVPRITHRLDANTSGVVVLAKTRKIARNIHSQFASGQVAKKYLARIKGHPTEDDFECDAAISDLPSLAGGRQVDVEGKPATTHFHVVRRFADGTSLLEVNPLTGRTNQIRLHLASLGFPIVGDATYTETGELAERQTLTVHEKPLCLHASQITLVHPSKAERVTFQAPNPDWL